MTSEIIIMNKEAIALAADSAVTHSTGTQSKIYTSANKIFALSKYCPVGVMFYGNADFMGVSWETIIKIHRDELGTQEFDSLKEFADHFINFLKRYSDSFPESEQEKYVIRNVYNYFYLIKEEIMQEVGNILGEKEDIAEEKIVEMISGIIDRHYDVWKNTEILATVPEDYTARLTEKYGTIFDKAREDIFEKLPLSEMSSLKLMEIGASLFAKSPQEYTNFDNSGVVIAGFGEKDTLTNQELLAVIMSGDMEASTAAANLLNTFDENLIFVVTATIEELMQVEGIAK